MNYQKVYNTVVRKLHGKGRAKVGSCCRYFVDGHPGCAIGCQPGFKKAFRGKINEGTSIKGLCYLKKVREFFGITKATDVEFLEDLQELHDEVTNWRRDGKHLRAESLKAFCERHDLRYSVPAS